MLEIIFVGAVIGIHFVLFGIYRKLDLIVSSLVMMVPEEKLKDPEIDEEVEDED